MENCRGVGSRNKILSWSSSCNGLFSLLVIAPAIGVWAAGQFHSLLGGVIAGVLFASLMLNGTLLSLFPLWVSTGRIDGRRMALLYARVNLYHAVVAAIAAAISLIAWFPALLVFSILGVVGTASASLIYYYAYFRFPTE